MSNNDWIRVERGMPCPICSHIDWCSLHKDGRKIICPRIRSTVKIKNAGYLHKVEDNGLKKHKKPHKRKSNQCINWEGTSSIYEKHLDTRKAGTLRVQLGLESIKTLRAFRAGWDGSAYTAPAEDGEGNMIGIMRRYPDGKKLWVPHSRNGLFIPKMKTVEGNVFILEGWSDTTCMVDMGFRAIGRANCETGVGYIKRWLYVNKKVAQVTVVADNDKAGKRGAVNLSRELYGQIRVAVLEVPPAFSDFRRWYNSGQIEADHIIGRSRML